MKSDISRSTFDRRQHYRSVWMQQGRVQLDADWNEQADVLLYRIETEAADVIGGCGGPLDAAGFRIATDGATLTAGEKSLTGAAIALPALTPGKLDCYIAAGRYYVSGLLCENEQVVTFAAQPDPPAAQPAALPGNYLVYLDAWERHISAEEEPRLREPALGGPDTATRSRVVWQVKAERISGPGEPAHCLVEFPRPGLAGASPRVRLQAEAKPETKTTGPCVIPPSAGYRGLGNQLYRVECHNPGEGIDTAGATPAADVVDVKAFLPENPTQVELTAAPGWPVGTAVQLIADNQTIFLAHVVAADGAILTLSRRITPPADPAKLRRVIATFKWSIENGSVASAIEAYNPAERRLTVRSVGPDDVRGFAPGDLVEITCPQWELAEQPGFLIQIEKVDEARREVVLVARPPADLPEGGRILRRWEGAGALQFDGAGNAWIPLKDGVRVQFDGGTLLAGDYWQIPARTATAEARSGSIDWPQVIVGGDTVPAKLPPLGVNHRYCPLAVVELTAAGVKVLSDCRQLFPPITQLTSLFFVGGDGQEAVPNPLEPATLVPLPRPLVAGVANGRRPVDGATVEFSIRPEPGQPPSGELTGNTGDVGSSVRSMTKDGGLASCSWNLDPGGAPAQQVEARLLNPAGEPIGLPVQFTASLSVADRVSYDPKNCKHLQAAQAVTVQAAIDALCRKAHGGCELVVGKQEPFETVGQAVEAALSRNWLDVCLCLRRGEHKITMDDLSPVQEVAKEGVRLRLAGCGRGTRVIFAGDAKYANWQALHLERLTIQFDTQLVLDRFADVSFEDCHLFGPVREQSAFSIVRSANRLRIANSLIEAWQQGVFAEPRDRVFGGLLPEVLFDEPLEDQERLRRNAERLCRELLARPDNERQAIANKIRQRLQQPDIVSGFLPVYARIANLIQDHVSEEGLVEAFVQLRGMVLKNKSSLAAVVDGASGDVRFENNDLCAGVSLYGEATSHAPLNREVLKALISRIAERELDETTGMVQFRGNKLGRLWIGDAIRKQLQSLIENGEHVLPPIYRAMFLESNVFGAPGNELLAGHVVMNGNIFAPAVTRREEQFSHVQGIAVANAAAFASNLCRVSDSEFHYAVPADCVVNQTRLEASPPSAAGPRTIIRPDNTRLIFLG